MKEPLKHYPKVSDDIIDVERWKVREKHLGSLDGSLDNLTLKFRNFLREVHFLTFDCIVKLVWLEQQFTVDGERRRRRYCNGLNVELSYGQFLKLMVGVTPHIITGASGFMGVATYLIDFFPDFLMSDPFKEPEKYRYPYKHVTLDFLAFVTQMDNRLEILEEAERRAMNFGEFVNWVVNWAYCYNEEVEDIYSLKRGNGNSRFHIKNCKLLKGWEHDKFRFDTKK